VETKNTETTSVPLNTVCCINALPTDTHNTVKSSRAESAFFRKAIDYVRETWPRNSARRPTYYLLPRLNIYYLRHRVGRHVKKRKLFVLRLNWKTTQWTVLLKYLNKC